MRFDRLKKQKHFLYYLAILMKSPNLNTYASPLPAGKNTSRNMTQNLIHKYNLSSLFLLPVVNM